MASWISRRFGSMLLSSSRSIGSSNFHLPLASIAPSPSITTHHQQKPETEIWKPNNLLLRSASSATSSSERPRKPAFSPAKGLPSKSTNHETRSPNQISVDPFINSLKNVEDLKNALAILSVVEINSAALIAYAADHRVLYPCVIAQSFGSPAIQLSMALMIRHIHKKMKSLNMKSGDDLSRHFVGIVFASMSACFGSIFLNLLYWGSSFWVIKKLLLNISSVEILTLTMMTLPFPLMSLVSLLRMRTVPSKPLPGLRESWGWLDRLELLKVLNFMLHGSRRACYWGTGLTTVLFLNYGILSFCNINLPIL